MANGLKHSIKQFNAGEVLFRDGEPRRHLFIVNSGQIAIFKLTAQNHRIPLGIIGSGQYLGETGLLEGKTTHGTWAVALTDVEAICIPHEAIEEQLKAASPWLVALSKGLAQKLRSMNELMRRNKWYDDSLDTTMLAIQENDRKKKAGN